MQPEGETHGLRGIEVVWNTIYGRLPGGSGKAVRISGYEEWRFGADGLIAELTRPVLLALGRYDFVVAPPSSWDRVRAQFRDLTVRVFEHSGHTPQLEEAALFDRELIRWLSAHE